MKKWIRWKGIIPFVCIIGVLIIFWFLILDTIVERVLESFGTRAVGAKVEIDRTDVSLFPAGLLITRLQVTHPDAPMTNAVEIASMDLSLDSRALLRKKIIVEEMSMDGVRLNTPRKTSGAIKSSRKKKTGGDLKKINKILEKAGCGTVELPSLKTPDIQKILATENLASLEIIQNYQDRLDNEKQKLQTTLTTLPDEKTFAEYRKRIEALQGKKSSLGKLLNTATDAVNIKKDIEKDIERLNNESKSFKKNVNAFNRQFSQLLNAPGDDIQRLKDKYSLSPQGMSNMSQLLIGTRLCGWWEGGYNWYQRVKPYLRRPDTKGTEAETAVPIRGKGLNVKFPEKNPLPDFLVRLARANIVLDAGELTGVIENATADQRLVGKPATFKFLGRQMKRMKSLNVIGEMNRIQPEHPKYKMAMNIKAFELRDFALSTAQALPVTVNEALTDLDLNFSLTGADLAARLNAGFKAVKMNAHTDSGSGSLASAFAAAISGIDTFDVRALVSGTIEDYTLAIQSDLDKTLKSAVGDLVKKEAAKFAADLKKEVMARVSGPMAEAEQQLKGFGPIGDELSKRLDLGNDLLKTDFFKKSKLPF